jgi:hypothetical protein
VREVHGARPSNYSRRVEYAEAASSCSGAKTRRTECAKVNGTATVVRLPAFVFVRRPMYRSGTDRCATYRQSALEA